MNVRESQSELNPWTSREWIKKPRRISCSQIVFFQNLKFEDHRLKVANMLQEINLSKKKIQYFGGPKHGSISALPQAWTGKKSSSTYWHIVVMLYLNFQPDKLKNNEVTIHTVKNFHVKSLLS
jgi:hypothetical protein